MYTRHGIKVCTLSGGKFNEVVFLQVKSNFTISEYYAPAPLILCKVRAHTW